ncbi:hypothetical protein [Deminuibacter soli]|uniref:DUF3995 domain-containing protein n=1 Tax=Deminuibacter soli TaxID=2291815 RepID=A0A3E1NKP9_9BACT|nr:hypothetical protein [Deminuibacter soli]RFM28515.1 hypothetical protein DXN05_06825 [Deminuibacter soli]
MSTTAHQQNKWLNQSLLWTVLLFILTGFHHYYGGLVYRTPWRQHIVPAGGAAIVLIVLALYLYRHYHKRIFLMMYLAIVALLFGLGITVFEGAYNHLLKNIFYFGGLNMHTWRALYPAPTYQQPDNVLIETTGIAQFFVGGVMLYYLWRVYKQATPTASARA